MANRETGAGRGAGPLAGGESSVGQLIRYLGPVAS